MLQCKLISVGKNKESWLESALQDYTKRLKGKIQLTMEWVKDDGALLQACHKSGQVVCLDPYGKQLDSPQFSQFLFDQFEKGGSRLTFVIGGAEGLPESLRSSFPLISLSKMTLTHQIARLVIVEQIYRGWEIRRGSPYHK